MGDGWYVHSDGSSLAGRELTAITAIERATYTSKSFLIALALVKGRISAEDAALASHVEVNSQIKRWGEVEDCKWLC